MALRKELAIGALLLGATGIGFAPILVRWSEVGPVATAFYRLLFALPVLWIWAAVEQRASSGTSGPRQQSRSTGTATKWGFVAAGLFFAGDLALWHWSLKLTSVANSTLLTNFAPFFVMIGARLLFTERITSALIIGLLLAFAGGAMLVRASFQFAAAHVWGDLVALATATFYAGYLLSVKHLRNHGATTAAIMARSGAVTCPTVLIVAVLSRENLLPTTAAGWAVLVALGLISHVGGQGLIAFSARHVSASFLSVSLMFQPVVAAVLAWVLLGEALGWLQIAGGVIILAGIAVASRSQTK